MSAIVNDMGIVAVHLVGVWIECRENWVWQLNWA